MFAGAGIRDTEVLLEAIERWRMSKALEAPVGMFAFAVWDSRDRTLTLARDRMGEKPRRKLGAHGLLRPEPIRRKWNEHLAGKHNWQLPIWNVLMFQAWMDTQGKRT